MTIEQQISIIREILQDSVLSNAEMQDLRIELSELEAIATS
jgi:hypothetical protein